LSAAAGLVAFMYNSIYGNKTRVVDTHISRDPNPSDKLTEISLFDDLNLKNVR
jgi:hypothetical protein